MDPIDEYKAWRDNQVDRMTPEEQAEYYRLCRTGMHSSRAIRAVTGQRDPDRRSSTDSGPTGDSPDGIDSNETAKQAYKVMNTLIIKVTYEKLGLSKSYEVQDDVDAFSKTAEQFCQEHGLEMYGDDGVYGELDIVEEQQ